MQQGERLVGGTLGSYKPGDYQQAPLLVQAGKLQDPMCLIPASYLLLWAYTCLLVPSLVLLLPWKAQCRFLVPESLRFLVSSHARNCQICISPTQPQ